jgi:cytochrome c
MTLPPLILPPPPFRRSASGAGRFAGIGGRAGLALVIALTATAALAQGDPKRGQEVFQDQCSGCHVLTGQGFAAPPLAGVYGRKAGSADFQYSDAMKKSGIVWDDTSLSHFLADPSQAVPGTAMTINLSDPQQRDDVIAYLRTLSPASK